MKNFLLGVVVTIAVLGIGIFGYLRLGMMEVQADIPPSGFETSVMNAAVHASVRRSAPEAPNPVPLTDENLIAGGKFYLDACAGCHGTPGKPENGKGAVLFPIIPELPVVGTTYTEAQVFWIAKHGLRRSGMFANGSYAKDESLWKVSAYIKRMNSLPPAVQDAVTKLIEAQH
ncbi:MAG: c-type cytochrome [Candidatus Acidiferrales bacterium]